MTTAEEIKLSVVVPVFNEIDNVEILISRMHKALAGVAWEIIFVDDQSNDGTTALLENLALKNIRIRHVLRVGRRGLSSACVEGILSSCAPYVAVMDGDLQHDETILPLMLKTLQRDNADLVVGSRYMRGGGIGQWPVWRQGLSSVSSWLAHRVLNHALTDPMSGFFALRREGFELTAAKLSQEGFKILLDYIVVAPQNLRIVEVPYQFGARLQGQSKLDKLVVLEFLVQIFNLKFGMNVSHRFFLYLLVGATGIVVHMAVLRTAHVAGLQFAAAQTVAVLFAMTNNFLLNNSFTYRSQRLQGRAMIRGLLSFYFVCAVGALANIAAATALFSVNAHWAIAGLFGAGVGAVWNYLASAKITWRV